MKPAPFRHHLPRTLAETVALLADVAPRDGRVLAGGQSLVPAMAFRLARPGDLVDINRVAELDRLAIADGALGIGALVRHAAFEHPEADDPLRLLLATVVRHIAHWPIRTRGTFCGSLAHADPAAEWCLVAATLDAMIIAASLGGSRTIPAAQFFCGAMATALREDELLAEARLPLLPGDTRFGFWEFSRRAGDYALAMALALYRVEDGVIREPRIGVGGAEASPRRLAAAEAAIAGQPPTDPVFRAAAEAAAAAIAPLEDHQTNAAYRRDLVRAGVYRALERAAR